MKTLERSLSALTGLGLCYLAAVKFLHPSPEALSANLVAGIEALLGVSALLRFRPRWTACGLCGLGFTLTSWTLAAGPVELAAGRCGCFGGYDATYFHHVLVAAAILAAGGALLELGRLNGRGSPRPR